MVLTPTDAHADPQKSKLVKQCKDTKRKLLKDIKCPSLPKPPKCDMASEIGTNRFLRSCLEYVASITISMKQLKDTVEG